MLYFGIALLYLLAHPELWVKAVFMAGDALPNYMVYASEAMWSQARIELTARLR